MGYPQSIKAQGNLFSGNLMLRWNNDEEERQNWIRFFFSTYQLQFRLNVFPFDNKSLFLENHTWDVQPQWSYDRRPGQDNTLIQGELEGGRNCFWHWKDMKLLWMHRTPTQPTQTDPVMDCMYKCIIYSTCSSSSGIRDPLLEKKIMKPPFLN